MVQLFKSNQKSCLPPFFLALFTWAFSCCASSDLNQLLGNPSSDTETFVPVEKAFKLEAEIVNNTLLLHFLVMPGHYLYKDRFSFSSHQSATRLGKPLFPKGKKKYDINFEQDMEIFPENITIKIPIKSSEPKPLFQIKFQGCADAGLCYPPQTLSIAVPNPNVVSVNPIAPM